MEKEPEHHCVCFKRESSGCYAAFTLMRERLIGLASQQPSLPVEAGNHTYLHNIVVALANAAVFLHSL